MKIDPRIQTTGDLQNEPVKDARRSASRAAEAKSGNATPSHAGDSIQISSRHAEVQQLKAQIAQVPEVRSERVAPLKAAVQQKSYNPDSGKVADAMLAEHSSKTAKT